MKLGKRIGDDYLINLKNGFSLSELCSFPSLAFCMDKYTERKKKRRVNFIPKFHSSLKKFVKYFTMFTKRYMYGTKVPNFIGL